MIEPHAADAEVTLDGAPIALDGEQRVVLVAVGDHVIGVDAVGYASERRKTMAAATRATRAPSDAAADTGTTLPDASDACPTDGCEPPSGDALPFFVNLGSQARAALLVTRENHTCAVLEDGRFKCWGENHEAQLRLGHADNHRGDQPGEMGDALPSVDTGSR